MTDEEFGAEDRTNSGTSTTPGKAKCRRRGAEPEPADHKSGDVVSAFFPLGPDADIRYSQCWFLFRLASTERKLEGMRRRRGERCFSQEGLDEQRDTVMPTSKLRELSGAECKQFILDKAIVHWRAKTSQTVRGLVDSHRVSSYV